MGHPDCVPFEPRADTHSETRTEFVVPVCGTTNSAAHRTGIPGRNIRVFYGACPKNETCAFSEGLTHHCTGAGGVGYEKILDWPPWKEPLPRRSWLTTP